MKIIIVGAGRIGYSIASELSDEGHNITVVDSDFNTISEVSNTLDVYSLHGNGASYDVLKEAGAEDADLLIALTDADETNLLCCLTAKKIGAQHTIARVRNRDYYRQISVLQDEFGLSRSINPEEETANEISRIIRFPSASKVEPFAGGKAESVEIRIAPESPLCDLPLSELHVRFPAKVLVCAAAHEHEVCIPRGDYVIRAGDRLNVIGAYREINLFLRKVYGPRRGVKSVMIMGGGNITYYLAQQLLHAGISLKVIERDEHSCARLKSELPKVGLVLADGNRAEILQEEGIGTVDAFVALTGDDDDNVITSMYAASMGVKKIVTKIKETHIIKMLADDRLESIVQPSRVATQRIVQYVRSMQNAYDSSIDALYYLYEGKVEVMEFLINGSFQHSETPIKQLKIPGDVLIAAIIRGNECIMPSGDDVIRAGDRVIVSTTRRGVSKLEDILGAKI